MLGRGQREKYVWSRTHNTAQGVRLVGISGTALVASGVRQLRLDDDGVPWSEADGAMDEVRARFGTDAIAPASALGRTGPKVKQRGDQQWGPDQTPS